MYSEKLYFSLICFVIFFLISKLSYKLKLFDIPNKNKFHKTKVPYTGGVSIFICGIIYQKLFNFDINEINIALSYCSLMVLLGFLDDKYTLNIGSRILFQIFAGYLMYNVGFQIISLGIIYPLGELKLGEFSLIFSLIIFLLFLNSSNYIDGIDGLSASLFLNSILIIIFFYGEIIGSDLLNFGIYLLIINSIFLLFNFGLFKLPKTFLGNSGSLGLGFFLFCYYLLIINNFDEVTRLLIFFASPLILFEFASTNLSRLIRSTKIFTGGHDHMHYLLAKKYNKYICLVILNVLNFIFASIFIYFSNYSSILSIIAFIICFIFYFFIREDLIKKIN